jgi:hypothetical protein
MNPSPGAGILTLDANTLVLENTADVDGGGIRVEGDSRLFMLANSTLIGYNHAPNGSGGGIEVVGPARADIGSSGYHGSAVILAPGLGATLLIARELAALKQVLRFDRTPQSEGEYNQAGAVRRQAHEMCNETLMPIMPRQRIAKSNTISQIEYLHSTG